MNHTIMVQIGRAFRIAEVVLGSPDEYRDSWVTNLEGNFGVLFFIYLPNSYLHPYSLLPNAPLLFNFSYISND